MKKIHIYIILFAVCLLSSSQAQILENISLKFGGVVAFQVNNNRPRLGISLGISKDIISWDKISIASEFFYISKGYVTDLATPTTGIFQNPNGNNKLEYLGLTIFGKLNIGGVNSKSNSYLIGGLNGSYFLGSTYAKSEYEQTTFGLLGGVGGEIKIPAFFKIILEFVITSDLTKATKSTTRKLRNTTIELKSGIKF